MSTETSSEASKASKPVKQLTRVIMRFAGDSGDGMQVTGNQFTSTSVQLGNDVSTFPDFPAEIRAPAGSLPGVSGFQISFASHDIHTPGDQPDVLVAMNPAALRVNLGDLKPGGVLIINEDAFSDKNLRLAGYEQNPVESGELDGYQVFSVELLRLTRTALEHAAIKDSGHKAVDRCKNFFALGITYWLYSRSLDPTLRWIEKKFAGKDHLIEANQLALKGGYNYAYSTELFQVNYEVAPAQFKPGRYRNISGNTAVAMGLIAAAQQTGLKLFYGSYPITPASDILHELARCKSLGVVTFQAEDEIAAIGSALGAAFAGHLGCTATSGPGMALKAETMGLAVMVELPLVIINIQRGGPSTGLPTKTEQADLLMAMHGRHGEAPVPIVAARSPGDCFYTVLEAVRIATQHMTPVIVLSDGYLANGAEPWSIPQVDDLAKMPVQFRTDGAENYEPYTRDDKTLARPWVVPGTPGLEHRIGGLEKADGSGNVSYDPANHEHMVHLRADKIAAVAQSVPDIEVDGPASGKLLVVGWGSTYGTITSALQEVREAGHQVSRIHLRHLHPFPRNLEDVLKSFDTVLVPEINMGQLVRLLRADFLVDAVSMPKVQGKPFKVSEICDKILEYVEGTQS